MKRSRRNGLVTIVALFILGLVTAALAVVARSAAVEARRTRAAQTSAQLRQLLLAGGADVAARSGGWGDAPPGPWSTPLPSELAGYTLASLAAPGAAPGTVEVTVTAEGGGRRAAQRMTWARQGDRWHLVDTALLGG